MKIRILLLFVALLSFGTVQAQKINLNVVPEDTKIFQIVPGGDEKSLGNGTAEIKVSKDEPVKLVFRKAGFRPIVKVYERIKGKDLPKTETIEMKERMVAISAQPYDAKIFANGVEIGTQKVIAYIPENTSVTVEVSKPGFFKKTRIYYNQKDKDLPPIDDLLTLEDRALQVKLFPADAQIFVDGKKVSDGSGEVVIPHKSCVAVEYRKEGFATVERSYCNKEGMPVVPLFENISLKDRVVRVNTTPLDAVIKVDGRQVSKGEATVKILEGACVDIIVEHAGYIANMKSFCNQNNMQAPPTNEHIILKKDGAYEFSIASDQANVNFSVSANAKRSPDDTWKIMNQIITNYFDVIEMSDKETQYIRTAWLMKNFEGSTVRTRIIVKPGSTGASQYLVKIQSEHAEKENVAAKNDEDFKEWDRILKTYKDVISEIQSRLQ